MSENRATGSRIFARLRPLMVEQRLLIGGGLLALFAEVAFRVAEPWPLKLIVDRVAQPDPEQSATGIGWADRIEPTTLIALAAAALIAFGGLRALCSYLNTIAFLLAGNRIVGALRADVFQHLQRLSLSWHQRTRSGDLIARLTADIGRLQEVSVTAALPLVGNLIAMLGMFAVMAWINLQLALIAATICPLVFLSLARRGKQIRTISRTQRKAEGQLAASASEALGAMRVVQSYSLEENLERAFRQRNNRSIKDGIKARRLAAGMERRTDVVIAIATAVVLLVGGRQVLTGIITPGDLVVFIFYLRSAYRPLRDTAKFGGRLARALASAERVVDVLDSTPEITDRPGARPAPALSGTVRFDDVWLSYEPGRDALRGVSFRVAAGERVALAGPSGAGKSSIVSLVLRLYEQQQGRVLLDGVDIRDYTLASLRSQVAIVLQESVLFGGTIRENIAHGNPRASTGEILEAAALANAHGFISRLPKGYDTEVAERGAGLSGGQRQRIAIARAALRRAPILILDEPTTGLDRESEQAVLAALATVSERCTTFLVSHDPRLVGTADRVLVVEDGAIVEAGSPSSLLAADGRLGGLRGPDPAAFRAAGSIG